MSEIYYVLTDRVNKGTIIKRTDDGDYKYNIGTNEWVLTTMFWDYEGGFDSPYEGLYRRVTKSEVNKLLSSNKETWKKHWETAKKIAHTYYGDIKSPIKGVSYEDYAMILSEYATDERERVIMTLSGLPLVGDTWLSIVKTSGIPKSMIEALQIWHTGTTELYQEHNRWVLKAVIIELKYLNNRKDLYSPSKTASRLMMLTKGFSKNEIYAGVSI